jgi:HAD superfamily hydrolase (TIGR01509 family)
MIDTIIFDMDGVICHTNPYHSIAFQAFFKKRGLNPSEQEYAAHMYGKSNSYIFSHFLKRTIAGEELQSFEDEKEGLFREIYAEHVDPIAGFQDFLNELVDRKYKLGVATSAPIANMDLILDTLGIRSFFGSTLASEDVTAHKPDPQVYQMSAENLQSNHSECLVFEDSHAGVSAAINAEMKVIGVLSSHSVSDLPPCCKYINSYDSSLIDFISGLS